MTEIDIVDKVNMVDHPPHYTVGEVECIDAIKASMTHEAYMGYLKGACLKYLWRYTYKKKPIEDVDKAIWYLLRLRGELDGSDNS